MQLGSVNPLNANLGFYNKFGLFDHSLKSFK